MTRSGLKLLIAVGFRRPEKVGKEAIIAIQVSTRGQVSAFGVDFIGLLAEVSGRRLFGAAAAAAGSLAMGEH